MDLQSNFEIIPKECGKTAIVTKTFTITYGGHTLTIHEGFVHDEYTFAPNLKDSIPAIIHDFAYAFKRWDDGTPIARSMADRMLRYYMHASKDAETHNCAGLYYICVRLGGWYGWYFKKDINVDPRSFA